MRTAMLAALVFLMTSETRAQGHRRPALIQDQNPVAGTTLSDSWMGTPAPASREGAGALAHGTPIPVSQLRIPAKARKEFERSEKAYHAGDLRASADHLEKAVQIYPDFLQAHNVLGMRYAGLGKLDDSLAEYQRALAIDANSGETYHNLAVVLFFMGRYDQAEEPARRAMELMPQEAATRYVLGCILVKRGEMTAEATRLLSESEGKFPNATLALALVAFKQGRVDDAIAKLREYLSAPQADSKAKAQCWLEQLTHQPTTSCEAAGTH